MRKYIPYILSVYLIIIFSFLVTEKAFSKEKKITTVDSVTTIPEGTSPDVRGITAGRAKSLVGIVAGLISLAIGWWAKLRSAKDADNGRTGAIVALSLGLLSVILSVIHLSNSAGAVFGSGSGKAGALVALALALIGMTLGGLTLRSRN